MSKFKIYQFFTGLQKQTCKEFAYSRRISINFFHNLLSRNVILFCIFNLIICNSLNAQNWQNLNSGTDYRLNVIYADTFDNYLYAGGYIHQAGGVSVNGMAKWNGITWSAMGNGANGDPLVIIRHDSELYVGGNITMNLQGGGRAYSIGKWNGIKWDTIPVQPFIDNMTRLIFAMASINNELYIGGIFNLVAGIPVNSLAKWDGNNWSSLNFPLSSSNISAICEYNGELYVGGNFYSSAYPYDTIQNIMRYDGSNWKSVGGGLHGGMDDVVSMVVYKNELYVAGTFTVADGNPGNYIARWNGNSWSDVGGGVIGVYGGNGQIWSLFVYHNELYAGGVFSYAGGVPAQHIAKWDGTKWCGLGSVFDNDVNTMACYHDSLYIGGAFQFIDGDTVNYIAKWTGGNYVDTCGNNSAIQEFNNNGNDFIVYPNPSNGNVTLEINFDAPENISISIYNIMGERVYDEAVNNASGLFQKNINISGLSNGIYFVQIKATDSFICKKIIKQ